jgi:phospholipid/cholesterol/gamma-HCH transport system permease protein
VNTVVAALGFRVLFLLESLGALLLRSWATFASFARARVDGRETLRQTDRMLRDAIPLMTLTCTVVGGIVAMQGLGYIKRYAASEVFGWAAGLSSYRDVGPLLLGVGLAARTGARNTAEVAMMAARERLDAVRALGLDPERVLVMPRVIATIFTAALLYLPASSLVLVVGYTLANIIGGQNIAISFWSFAEYIDPTCLANGIARMTLFGAIIGVASCHAGVALEASPDKSAGAIGRAVYFGSVVSLCGVMVGNAVLSLVGSASS